MTQKREELREELAQHKLRMAQEYTLQVYLSSLSSKTREWAVQMNELSLVDPEKAIQKVNEERNNEQSEYRIPFGFKRMPIELLIPPSSILLFASMGISMYMGIMLGRMNCCSRRK